ncbi:hypothetical protein GII33_03625 [Gordonia pseudamarae]|jgi:lysophospholipase L1-like esterase|uniref:SGNH hydrolase-type esterase domain-containing protein n=1 Tax=Gordonia pseudamarae TaxID=2831662 RepID=A0ABX6IFL4_9ACTN|nr:MULTISPECIES: SGNH/GDSL hydrolase family protein [Gordonia]MBD0021509.1 SGNH/GDSL hydrolase family protein [Gordonia sp. (in: high G+C Gram-positive bacteria)]QHN25192.1 hypothetical protein GII33_03625 [Gordonia pseudamarae]QHN34124.1 hypothetical protein GII31_03620 [Gordonia pseudamarae]
MTNALARFLAPALTAITLVGVSLFPATASAGGNPNANTTSSVPTPKHKLSQPGQIVVLGDSFAANSPDMRGSCKQNPQAWPEQLGRLTGRRLVEEACSGASFGSADYQIGDEARRADKAGGITTDTALFLMQFGMNDQWNGHDTALRMLLKCLAGGHCEADHDSVTSITPQAIVDRTAQVIEYVRYYAPNARIAFVGYPELLHPGAKAACIDVAGREVTVRNSKTVIALIDKLDSATREAATMLNVEFVDARAATAGRGLCTPKPLVHGVLDPKTDVFGIPVHPTVEGDAVMAATIRDQFGL